MTSYDQNLTLDQIQETIIRNAKSFAAAGVLAAILFGGYYYVRVYRVDQDARAHVTLTEVLAEVTRAANKPEAWQDVEVAARTGYRQHSSSDLAPYFLAIEADALLAQNKTDEGKKLLAEAVGGMSKKTALTDMYALKLARIDLASQDDASKKEGLARLEALAQNSASLVHDEALYRLGVWYAHEGNQEQARKVFEQLIAAYKETNEQAAQSVWMPLAQEQLAKLS